MKKIVLSRYYACNHLPSSIPAYSAQNKEKVTFVNQSIKIFRGKSDKSKRNRVISPVNSGNIGFIENKKGRGH